MRSSSHPVEHTSTIRYETLQLARKKRINEVELYHGVCVRIEFDWRRIGRNLHSIEHGPFIIKYYHWLII